LKNKKRKKANRKRDLILETDPKIVGKIEGKRENFIILKMDPDPNQKAYRAVKCRDFYNFKITKDNQKYDPDIAIQLVNSAGKKGTKKKATDEEDEKTTLMKTLGKIQDNQRAKNETKKDGEELIKFKKDEDDEEEDAIEKETKNHKKKKEKIESNRN